MKKSAITTITTALSFLFSINEASKNYPNAGLYLDKYNCRLDSMITPENFLSFQTEVTNIWNGACGSNRGIFVLDPPDGQTYNCGKWPLSWNCTLQTLFTSPPNVGRNALDLYIQSMFTIPLNTKKLTVHLVLSVNFTVEGKNHGEMFLGNKAITEDNLDFSKASFKLTDDVPNSTNPWKISHSYLKKMKFTKRKLNYYS